MRLTVLGCSPSFQNPGGASSAYLVEEGRTRLLVDCGHGAVGRLRAEIEVPELSGILLSHLHPDHFFDLVPLAYLFLFRYPTAPAMPLWVPPGGMDTLEHLGQALCLPQRFFETSFRLSEYDPDNGLTIDGLDLSFASTQHFVSGFAMRFDSRQDGTSLAYSSDTGMTARVVDLMRGVMLAVIEATVLEYAPGEVEHGHLTPDLAGCMAKQARVGRLLLTHYPTEQAEQTQRQASAAWGRMAELAREGSVYEV